MEGKHLHEDERSNHIRKWKKTESRMDVSTFFMSPTIQFTNVFPPPTLSACLCIKENQWIILRQFLPSQISQMWICYFNTNDTTCRKNSVMQSSQGSDRFLLQQSPGRPAFGGGGENRNWLPEELCTRKLDFQGWQAVHVKLILWHILPEIYQNLGTASDFSL